MRLYFVRHGESEADILNVISSRGYRHPLTEAGREQARRLAEALRGCGARCVYTGPLQRTVETAQMVAASLRLPLKMTDALRAFDCGVAEGRSGEEPWALVRQVRADWYERSQWESRIPGGESFAEVRQRFIPFVRRVTEDGAGRALVLVSHGALYRHLLPQALVNVTPAFAMSQDFPPTGYVLAETTAAGLVCLAWCGTQVAENSSGSSP